MQILTPAMIEAAYFRAAQRAIRLPSGCIVLSRKVRYTPIMVKLAPKVYKLVNIHRLAFLFWNGGDGEFDVRHKCDFPPCFNHEHLERGSTRENFSDMVERKRLARDATGKFRNTDACPF